MSQDILPGVKTTTLNEVEPNKLRGHALIDGPSITLDAASINADLVAPYRLDQGRVVVKAAAGGKYLLAGGTAGTPEAGSKPVLDSAEPVDGDWNGTTITLYRNGVQVAQVTLATATAALVAGELNADADFARHAVASDNGGSLKITGVEGGAGEGLRVSQSLDTAWANNLGTTAAGPSEDSAAGSSPDYRITLQRADLKDQDHADQDAPVANALSGVFELSKITGMTGEARAVFERRGSVFF